MSIDEEEIRDYLESKPLSKKNLTGSLSDNVNDYDQGGDAKEEKIGTKSSLARVQYLMERDKKIQFGDKQAIAEYMAEQTARNEEIKARVEQSRLEYELIQEEKARLAKEARITPEDRENERLDIEKLERKKDKEIANIQDYFNASKEEWQEYLNDRHTAQESLARVLIARTDNGKAYCCTLHKYQKVIESNVDWGLVASTFSIEPIENHFRTYEPEKHRAAIIESINQKYDKLIQERKDKTLIDPDIKFKQELGQISKIKTRVDGDWAGAGKKITKGEQARIREAEEAQNEENRRIYRGLY